MSYELRTPLTSIGGFAEMLAAGYAGKLAPAASDYVGAIVESVGRLSKLIDDVLDLTQADSGGIVLEEERVDIGGLCRAAADAFRQRAAERKVEVDLKIDSSAGTVIGDSRRLRESVEHLLSNAISFGGEGGMVKLAAHGDEEAATISVSDNGPGIAKEAQARVFERFHRVSHTGGSDPALGLGLPLTRQFVEAHGGTVELDSAPGKGTTVTLSIPRKRS